MSRTHLNLGLILLTLTLLAAVHRWPHAHADCHV